MALPQFIFTTNAKLSSISKSAGNFIISKDTGEMHVDINASTRVRVGVGDLLGTGGLQSLLDNKAPKSHSHSDATTSAAGFMTAAMVTKLNGIAAGANKYSHPTTAGNKHIPAGGSSGQILRWSADGTAVWGNDNNTTYGVVSASANGLMTPALLAKLNGIAEGANKYSLPTASTTVLGGVKLNHITTVTNLGWTSGSTTVPTTSAIAFWNGAYDSGNKSNLTYCVKGAFGTIVTKNLGEIVAGVSLSSKTLTVTMADGTSKTFTTVDTNTTYTSLKNPYALTLQFSGTTIVTYDGSAAKTFNVTPDGIGAAATIHSHSTLNGYGTPGTGTKGIVVTTSDYGVTEIGRYLDFHTAAGQDYKTRIHARDDGGLQVTGGSVYGSLVGNVNGTAEYAKYMSVTAAATASLKNIRTVTSSTSVTTSNTAVGEIVFLY